MKNVFLGCLVGVVIAIGFMSFVGMENSSEGVEARFEFYEVNPRNQNLKFYWKDEQKVNYKSFQNLKADLQKKKENLVFAMNAGMYLKGLSPQGLFIEKGVLVKDVNRQKNNYGNFYMEPNGIFYLTTSGVPVVCQTKDFKNSPEVKYATQSGPMLLIDGKLHSRFILGSSNVHVRNGVGVLPNGNVLFAISKEPINFYDFATFFKNKGCNNALYLDGFVSRMYLPEKGWNALDKSSFGVIIGVVE